FVADYLWGPGYWLPFVGWFFYFVLGFYCGKNYYTLMKILRNKWILALPVISLIIMLLMNKYFLIDQDSKRVDMLVYATSVIFFIMYIYSNIKMIPNVVVFISNYSFSIFLLNMFFFVLLKFIEPPAYLNIFTYSFSVFLITVLLCIGTAYMFN